MDPARTFLVLFALCAALAGCADIEARRFYRAGTEALDRGESKRAVADLERAAALAPEISEIQNHLGIAYEDAGRSDDAVRAYERAIALDCDNRAAESNLRELRARRVDQPRPDDLRPYEPRSSPDGAEPNTGQGASR
jgi:Flp pilus assembly protein TadD